MNDKSELINVPKNDIMIPQTDTLESDNGIEVMQYQNPKVSESKESLGIIELQNKDFQKDLEAIHQHWKEETLENEKEKMMIQKQVIKDLHLDDSVEPEQDIQMKDNFVDTEHMPIQKSETDTLPQRIILLEGQNGQDKVHITTESIGFPESDQPQLQELPTYVAEDSNQPQVIKEAPKKVVFYLPVSNHIRAYHETLYYHATYKAFLCSKIEKNLILSLKIHKDSNDPATGSFDYESIASTLETRKSMLEYSLSKLQKRTLLYWPPRHAAHQLSLLDAEIMSWIQENDLKSVNNDQKKPDDEIKKRQEHPGLYAHFDFFNFISIFVQETSDLKNANHKEVISHWIKSCMYLWKINSFNMLKCIVVALVPIARKSKTISSKELETLNKMYYLLSEDNNYKRLRRLHSKSENIIPFLGIIIHDLNMSLTKYDKSTLKSDQIISKAMDWIERLPIHGKRIDEDFRYWILGRNIGIETRSF